MAALPDPPDKASGGDPGVVHPSDSRAESQAGLNGPSGSPTSPPEPVTSAALPDPPDWAAQLAAFLDRVVPAFPAMTPMARAALAEGVSALARASEWEMRMAQSHSEMATRLDAAEEQVAALRAEAERAAEWLENRQDPPRYAAEILRAALSPGGEADA